MTIYAALLSSFCLAVSITYAVQLRCDKTVLCPCGSTNRNVTLCIQPLETNPCPRLSNCRSCEDGLSTCLDCPDGFEGSFCNRKVTQAKSRQKRQFYYPVRRPHRPGNQNQRISAAQVSSHCPNLESPKLGSIRCFSSNQLRTCVGRCLPGYTFRGYIAQEITVECRGGAWTPFTEFPDCESGGHCDLVVQGHGSFNCTTGMDGTRCDVKCDGRYAERYFCYPGRPWEPRLPYCVRPKEATTSTVIEEMQNCRCEYGASCDSRGNCVCPAGRTGTFCETAVPEKVMCRDPGFISNGLRKNTDGTESTVRQTYGEGESVVYSCSSEKYALQGSSLLTCKGDRTWSRPLPKCIKPRVAPQVSCPDPGQVANAERLNSDGSPSVGVQQYSVGQSVVYTCHPGFALQRRSLITCLASGAWSSRTPHCTRVTPPAPATTTTTARPDVSLRFCRDPGVDPNGSRRPASPSNRRGFPQGSHLEYSCREGYVLSGEPDLFCIVSGRWSASRPRCEAQSRTPLEPSIRYCDNPGPISNGRVVYVPALSFRRPPADASEDGEMEERYPQGARLLYSCNRGYSFRDREEAKTVTLTCEDNGRWSDSPPRCLRELAYCLHPGSISNGRMVYVPALSERRPRPPDIDDDALDERYPQGGRLRYSCDDGYFLEGTPTLTCEESGYWSAVPPSCVEDSDTMDYCDRPGPIANGRFVHVPNLDERRRPPSDDVAGDEERYPEGSRLRFSCNNGYRLRGNATLTCQASGFWSGAFPRCVPIVTSRNVMFCENPGPILNGRVQSFVPGGIRGPEREREGDVDEYPEGSRLEYSCQEGYQVEGSDRLTCQSSGFWSPPNPPTCIGECGRSFMQTSHRVLNGLKTETGEWPWVVAIFVEQNNSSRLVCGGAVLNPNTVITAGHCISRASSFILRFGKLHRSIRNDDTEVLVRRSTRVIIHPDFKNSTLESDIGLLMFQPRIRYSVRVQPICLPSAESTARNLMTGKVGYVAGWGITEREAPSDELLLAKLPVLTNEDCRDSYRRQNITLPITRNMFCAGHADARQSACEGDSGSPLVFYDGVAQRYTLEGLVSFGVEGQCGLQGRYTIFTKVFLFLPWIYRNLQ